jgi:DNA-binding NtrC family response regulator
MQRLLKVLTIDDDPIQLNWFRAFFKNFTDIPCELFIASTMDEFQEHLQDQYIGLVITDYFMPDLTGRDILNFVKKHSPNTEVVILTSGTELEDAVNLMREGAYDFLVKPIKKDVLIKHLLHVYDHLDLVQENLSLKEQQKVIRESKIISESENMKAVLTLAQKVAASEANLLILGESGTGKELVAKAVYSWSTRNTKPFVVTNIAALPESLIESELFGHAKGAFTGADNMRIGRFEEADGGTLFIDEIGDVSPAVQVKLLRTIQFKEFQRVGDNTLKKVDVRIIAATHRDLKKMVSEGKFREDLYYRLRVVSIQLPPLRERKRDILEISNAYLKRSSPDNPPHLTEAAAKVLLSYEFPGNVRELENILEHGLVLSGGQSISPRHLPEFLLKDSSDEADIPGGYEDQMQNFERKLLIRALDEQGWNQSAAARSLEMTERRLRNRMTILDIHRQQP